MNKDEKSESMIDLNTGLQVQGSIVISTTQSMIYRKNKPNSVVSGQVYNNGTVAVILQIQVEKQAAVLYVLGTGNSIRFKNQPISIIRAAVASGTGSLDVLLFQWQPLDYEAALRTADSFLSNDAIGVPELLLGIFGISGTTQTGTINRVHMQPLWIPHDLVVGEAFFAVATASAGQNMRLGIYEGKAYSPAGGALLWDSGDIDVTVTGAKNALISPNVRLSRGMAWFALATQNATMAFFRQSNISIIPAGATYPTLEGCGYTMGAWGALTNPCPTSPYQLLTTRFLGALRVVSLA